MSLGFIKEGNHGDKIEAMKLWEEITQESTVSIE
jgi:hypothetical protein